MVIFLGVKGHTPDSRAFSYYPRTVEVQHGVGLDGFRGLSEFYLATIARVYIICNLHYKCAYNSVGRLIFEGDSGTWT